MTYEQLLQQIRANAINFIAVYQGADEVCRLIPFYNVPITAEEHEQILALMPKHGPDLAAAVFLSKAEVCIDQANHAPYHTYFGDVQRPHYRCNECGRIRKQLEQENTITMSSTLEAAQQHPVSASSTMPHIPEPLHLETPSTSLTLRGLHQLLQERQPEQVQRLQQDLQAVINEHTAKFALLPSPNLFCREV